MTLPIKGNVLAKNFCDKNQGRANLVIYSKWRCSSDHFMPMLHLHEANESSEQAQNRIFLSSCLWHSTSSLFLSRQTKKIKQFSDFSIGFSFSFFPIERVIRAIPREAGKTDNLMQIHEN